MEKSKFSYLDVLEEFGAEKVAARYDSVIACLKEFIKSEGLSKYIVVNEGIVNQTIIDYFTDIYRLKKFHDIDLANFIKIHSYLGYWINRRKPLQVVLDDPSNTELAFCNENFVSSYFARYLYDTAKTTAPNRRTAVSTFLSTLNYSLRYRVVTPQTFELMIEGFAAGVTFPEHPEIDS